MQVSAGSPDRAYGAAAAPAVRSALRLILSPRVVLPVVFGLALLAAVVAIGDPSATWRLMVRAGGQTLLAVFLLTLPYLAARGWVWRRLLAEGGVQPGWRPFLLAFAGGEFAKNVPGGAYMGSYLLRRSGVSLATGLAATAGISGLEVLAAVPVVLGWGVPGWTWLVPTVSALLVADGLVLGLLWWLSNPLGREAWLPVPRLLRPAMDGVRTFLASARPLLSLRTVRTALLPTALSLGIIAADLVLLGRAVGIPHLDFAEAAVVSAFTTLVLILFPIPTDLGVMEGSGLAVLLAFGATRVQAVATLLLLRVVLTGGTMLITGVVAIALSRQPRQPSATRDRVVLPLPEELAC